MKKFLLSATLVASVLAGAAQNPTTVTNVTNCNVFRNFNTSDEGFSSPSIYSDANDVSFFWNAAAGAEIENSGLNSRTASLISPIYLNSLQGQTTIGFRYEAPNNAEYRVRVISGALAPSLEILATTANGNVWTPLPANSGNICIRLDDADLAAGGMVRFEFSFRTNQPANFLFDDLALTVEGGPLPVTFLGLVARKNTNGSHDLLWNVGEEVNVRGYVVESSSNGTDFSSMGYVTATGKKTYSLNIPEPITRTTFFRIKNEDFDGRSKYSSIVKIIANPGAESQLSLYPVPATSQVYLQHGKATETAQVSVISIDGKLIKKEKVMPSSLQTSINIQQLKPGMYIVRYDDGKGQVSNVKLVKN